jgi:hypothetical protein
MNRFIPILNVLFHIFKIIMNERVILKKKNHIGSVCTLKENREHPVPPVLT